MCDSTPEYIKRMEEELRELGSNINKAKRFLDDETGLGISAITDEIQRRYLAIQIEYMEQYYKILSVRLELENKIYQRNVSR